jgi:hypothetical protein
MLVTFLSKTPESDHGQRPEGRWPQTEAQECHQSPSRHQPHSVEGGAWEWPHPSHLNGLDLFLRLLLELSIKDSSIWLGSVGEPTKHMGGPSPCVSESHHGFSVD